MGLRLCILSIHSQIQTPFLACLSPLSSNKVPVIKKKSIKKWKEIEVLPKSMKHIEEKNISYVSESSNKCAEILKANCQQNQGQACQACRKCGTGSRQSCPTHVLLLNALPQRRQATQKMDLVNSYSLAENLIFCVFNKLVYYEAIENILLGNIYFHKWQSQRLRKTEGVFCLLKW